MFEIKIIIQFVFLQIKLWCIIFFNYVSAFFAPFFILTESKPAAAFVTSQSKTVLKQWILRNAVLFYALVSGELTGIAK